MLFWVFLYPNFLLSPKFYFCYVYKESELSLILVIFKETWLFDNVKNVSHFKF